MCIDTNSWIYVCVCGEPCAWCCHDDGSSAHACSWSRVAQWWCRVRLPSTTCIHPQLILSKSEFTLEELLEEEELIQECKSLNGRLINLYVTRHTLDSLRLWVWVMIIIIMFEEEGGFLCVWSSGDCD